MVEYVAAVDQGTTGTRCILFDSQGHSISQAYAEHQQILPRPGWVEHNPIEIWHRTQEVMSTALDSSGLSAKNIRAIGIANQRETTVVWDRSTGKPYYNAIVWQCMRTQNICSKLIADGLEDFIRERTGLVIATYFSGTKLKWLLDNVPDLREAAERGDALFGTVDSWLVWNMTGGTDGGLHVTDITNASRTMLMNLKTCAWDQDMLDLLDIPAQMLPQIVPNSSNTAFGTAVFPGSQTIIPIGSAIGDQHGALFGQTCFAPGEAKNTYGTGSFLLMNTGDKPVPSEHGLLSTVGYALEGQPVKYALEGSIAITGAAIQWLRDNLGLIQSAAESEAVASSVPDTGGVYFVPAFSGLYAPYWDMYARGTIVGMTRYTNRAHIVRATLEAICYQTREVLQAMENDSHIALKRLQVDGGAVVNNFLMQLQSDILGVSVVRPRVGETTALGAAYMAGLATGVWSGLDDLRTNWQVDREFSPEWDAARREAQFRDWRRAVGRAMRWVTPEE